MENINIRARNNLDVPVRLTLTNVRSRNECEILITVGQEGTALKDYYRVCVDTDLLPSEEWEEIGSLQIDTESKVSFAGLIK